MNHITDTTELAQSSEGMTARDVVEAVRATGLLADLTVSTWSAERTDPQIMEDAKRQAGAVGNVGRAVKNLLAGCDTLLKETRSAYTACRTVHYGLTLPWVVDPHAPRLTGPRLLPNALFERYITEISRARRAAETKLDEFIAEYPDLIRRAMANLAGLANMGDYPQQHQVRALFAVKFDFEPIPAGSSFSGLPGHVLDKLSAGLRRKQERMVEAASAAMWTEARDRVRHIAERLGDQEAKFKSTTVENVRELLTLLPGWNVTGSPRVGEIVQDVESMLQGVTAEDLRKDQIVRKQVAGQAQAVLDKLASWGV